jgi:hypothetical protein
MTETANKDPISQSDFAQWKSHPVTVALAETLEDEMKRMDEAILSSTIIVNEPRRAAYMQGYREGMRQFISFRDSKYEDAVGEAPSED